MLFAGSALCGATPSTEQLTELFLPPVLSDPKISPGGDYIGFVARQGDEYAIGVYTVATKQIQMAVRSEVRPLGYWWKGPRRLLVETTSLKLDTIGYTAVDVDGRNLEDLWRLRDVRGRVVDALPDDARHVLVIKGGEIVRVDLDRGTTTREAGGDLGRVGRWVFDGKTQPRAAISPVGRGEVFLQWNVSPGGKWQEKLFKTDEKKFLPFGVADDPRFLLGWDYGQGGEVVISRFDTVTAQQEAVARKKGLDPMQVMILERTRRAVAVNYTQGAETLIEPLAEASRSAIALLQSRFAGYTPVVLDELPDKTTWLVWTGNSRLPGAYALFNTKSGEIAPVALSHDAALTEERFAPAEFFAFPDRSGHQLTGRLWRPVDGARVPLVLFCPHALPGRPARDVYDSDVQALVACGYAVAEVNVRGIYGFGDEWRAAANGDVGRTFTEELEDAARALAGQKVVDGAQVYLLGVGMGGTLAIQAAAKSTRFAAVATVDAPAKLSRHDLLRFSEDDDIVQLSDKLGGWWETGKIADELSPVRAIGKVRVPALLLGGENSLRGPSEDAARILRAAKAGGAPAKIVQAYSWSKYPKQPTLAAQEAAGAVVKIVEFFGQATGVRAEP